MDNWSEGLNQGTLTARAKKDGAFKNGRISRSWIHANIMRLREIRKHRKLTADEQLFLQQLNASIGLETMRGMQDE